MTRKYKTVSLTLIAKSMLSFGVITLLYNKAFIYKTSTEIHLYRTSFIFFKSSAIGEVPQASQHNFQGSAAEKIPLLAPYLQSIHAILVQNIQSIILAVWNQPYWPSITWFTSPRTPKLTNLMIFLWHSPNYMTKIAPHHSKNQVSGAP